MDVVFGIGLYVVERVSHEAWTYIVLAHTRTTCVSSEGSRLVTSGRRARPITLNSEPLSNRCSSFSLYFFPPSLSHRREGGRCAHWRKGSVQILGLLLVWILSWQRSTSEWKGRCVYLLVRIACRGSHAYHLTVSGNPRAKHLAVGNPRMVGHRRGDSSS